MYKKLSWQAYANDQRVKVIEEVKDVISRSDGSIMNFNMFSDLALNLSIEIKEHDIEELYQALSKVFKISSFDSNDVRSKSEKDCLIFLNISFGSGSGELRQEIPAVPG